MYSDSQKILGVENVIVKKSLRITVPDMVGICSTSNSPECCQLSLGGREIITQSGHT